MLSNMSLSNIINIVIRNYTCRACAGTLKIIASLKIGLFSPFLIEVLFLCIFFPCCSKYTLKIINNFNYFHKNNI